MSVALAARTCSFESANALADVAADAVTLGTIGVVIIAALVVVDNVPGNIVVTFGFGVTSTTAVEGVS